MRRCAFLSTDNLEDFFVYDELVKPFLKGFGWSVEDVSWKNKKVDYGQFDLVIVRSTWDYQDNPQAFLNCIKHIHNSGTALENHYELMRWNLSKSYLKDLANKGVPILRSSWYQTFEAQNVQQDFARFASEQLIIKPLVSANADHTYLFTADELQASSDTFSQVFSNRPFMVQAFESSVLEVGEYSLFYFANEFSHAICKQPAKGDFRVQEEHGGQLSSVRPTSAMLSLAEQTLQALPHPALYARIDILETARGLAIIEVELIEPSLYFNMDEESAERFATAVHKKYA